jgi:hypothetical protein
MVLLGLMHVPGGLVEATDRVGGGCNPDRKFFIFPLQRTGMFPSDLL